jgi:hypothetical protein
VRTLTLSLLMSVLLAGCTSRVGGAPAPDPSRPETTTTTTTVTTTEAGPLTAADGTDMAACALSDCEVLVTTQVAVPLDPKFGCTSFTVVYFTPDRVAFNVDCAGTGYVTGYFLGLGALRLANGITIECDQIDETGAVLHFIPRTTTKDPGRNEVSGQFGAAFT